MQLVCIGHGHEGTARKQAVHSPASKGVVLNGEVQTQICCITLIPGNKIRYLLGTATSVCCEEESVPVGKKSQYLLGSLDCCKHVGQFKRGAIQMWGSSNVGQFKIVGQFKCGAVQMWGSSNVGHFKCGALQMWGSSGVFSGDSDL